ncbi:DUF4360 domain-containing protein [Streptomyces sp. NBC_01373]|uniref:DUF4360 domain-containing protein n=1 Tax=Streptomyces sp. NBC_01373 TaxID=2903843 RepID=UPI00225705B8|nr:DUF4360 domain-containing protein [Streptomyces sp. NBC_01373]MCX4701055.1 DUF4360 domain-containing protein [Streptomyces sp. NBC_01373]
MTTGLLLSGAAITALLTAALPAQGPSSGFEDPPPDKIVIKVATVNGSGCPQGTAAVAVSEDNTAFTVTYSDYLAQAGGNSDPTAFRKNCQLNLIVHVPQGFTYAIASADYRGFAALQPGASAVQRASYYFQGSSSTVYKNHPFTGPHDDNWQATDTTDWAQLVWAPCGVQRNFNINTELRVSAGTQSPGKVSFMTMDSTDGDISTVYHLAWKECPEA